MKRMEDRPLEVVEDAEEEINSAVRHGVRKCFI
jgi:hypothetical protein